MDNRSDHNFVQPPVVNFLNLEEVTVLTFSVIVGSGQRLHCDGVVKVVPLTINGLELNLDLYVLSFHEGDIVLGVSWLAALGPVLID